MKTDTIFVQIAAYRDPELIPTIENLLQTAKYKSRLVIGIVWQHTPDDTWDTLDKYKNKKQFRIIDIPIADSRGVCWARSRFASIYKGEKYTLQLDSHHRFTKNWDETLITMLEKLRKNGSKKPLLTSYLPSYFPDNDPDGRLDYPWKMNFDYFLPEGPIFTRPSDIPDIKNITEPILARFLSAHFVFTDGAWITDVPYDPMLYFHGEEPSLAIRSFTHGYDLYHPHSVVAWHEYTRSGKKKHWDDATWGGYDKVSFSRTRKLLGMDNEILDFDFGKYGLGTERSLHEYELYAGVKFSTRQVHQDTIDQKQPPISTDDEEFESRLCNRFKYCINVWRESVKEPDYDCWVIAFEDADGKELVRLDAAQPEVANILRSEPTNQFAIIWREFDTSIRPAKWTVWPHSISKGWMDRIQGDVPHK